MISALILTGLALGSGGYMLALARKRNSSMRRAADLPRRIRPVDINAFRTLVDPGETEFLRARLSGHQFRKVQRERLRAAVQYVAGTTRNANLLIRIGDAARRSSDPSTAEAGQKLVNSALRLRVLSIQAMGKLYLDMAFPGSHVQASELAEVYERVTSLTLALGRVQRAAAPLSSRA